MANKIIKYNLTAGGTIPTYIADGGYYPKANGGASPQDWDLIGATTDGSSETGLGELANKAAVKSYLDTYTSDWKQVDPSDHTKMIDFDQDAAEKIRRRRRRRSKFYKYKRNGLVCTCILSLLLGCTYLKLNFFIQKDTSFYRISVHGITRPYNIKTFFFN